MVWPFKSKFRKQIARIEITGAIAGSTRKRVLEALKTVEDAQKVVDEARQKKWD